MRYLTSVLMAIFSTSAAGCAAFYQRPPTALSDAAWRGDIDTVRLLVKNGADINELNGTPLFLAARGGRWLAIRPDGMSFAVPTFGGVRSE
jgi:hypothetical protein